MHWLIYFNLAKRDDGRTADEKNEKENHYPMTFLSSCSVLHLPRLPFSPLLGDLKKFPFSPPSQLIFSSHHSSIPDFPT